MPLFCNILGGISKSITHLLVQEVNLQSTLTSSPLATATLLIILEHLRNRVSNDKQVPWQLEYLDNNIFQPTIKVDSHQLKENGSKGNHYEQIMPNNCLVYMNHIANCATSFTMDQATCKLAPHQEHYFKQPDNIKCPLGPCFEIAIG
jgi:hypothetical protein